MLLPGFVCALLSVRTSVVLFMLAGLLVLPGCWVQSVNGLSEAAPFGTSDKDQTYDPALVGAWITTDLDCTTTLNVTGDAKEYHWKVTSEGKACANDKGDIETDYYEGELFNLDDHKFLDLTARIDDVCKACLPVHWIFKVKIEQHSLTMIPIDSAWLEKAEKDKTVTLATSHSSAYTLVASPKELKDFCRKYADDENVFKPDPNYVFRAKQL